MSIAIELDGRVAVVTGAASGIGRAIALTLARAGATIAVVDRDADGLGQTAGQIGGSSSAHVADLGDPAAILAMRNDVVGTHGAPDVIVNAAGWDRIEPFMDNDPAIWQGLADVNLLGPVRVCHAFLETILAAESRTTIVNISSDAGRVGSSGETVYAGTKGGVIAFSKSLAREMARHRINVNCVCPGPTDTPLLDSMPDKLRESLQRAIPFRRLAEPQDVADAVVFLSSDLARYITGQVLSVSGGLTMAG